MTEDTKRDRGILTKVGRCLHTGSTSLEGLFWKLKINLGELSGGKSEMEYFGENQLETKKQYVLYVVEVISRSRNLPMPSFNFYGCPDEEENQLAHYHPDSNTICISKRQLNLQSFDELRNTMVHEAAHILECNHDDNFSKENFINNLFVGELSVEAFIIERGKEKKDKTNETIETMVVKIGNEEIRFRVPLHINTLSFDPVTKHSNLGIDIEYIIKNEYLSVVGRGSSESKARKNFQEEFRELCWWCWDEETLLQIIQKKRLESLIVK